MDNGKFCISSLPLMNFYTIPDLISHYSEHDILCWTLKASHFILDGQQRNICKWEIDRNTFQLTKLIELNELYEVWEGKWNDTLIVVKRTKELFANIAKFFEEVELMKQLKHDNIIEFYGACTQEEPLCIITEYTNYENLQAYLKKHSNFLHYPQLIDMGTQIASAMAYLEEKNCILCNLQATNIALHVYHSFTCKVANFSCAKIISKGDYVESSAYCPVRWTAPESLRSKHFTIKSDVWSFGIVLYELITCGNEPYPEMDEVEVLNKLKVGYQMACPTGCTVEMYEVMKECWREDANNRPSFYTLHQKFRKL